MDENNKYIHNQNLTDTDYLEIKKAVKGKKNNNEAGQLPSGLFIVFAAMAFISYTTNDKGTMILYIIGAILCMIGIFYVHYIDRNGVLLYKFVFAKCVMKKIVFYQDFMECHNDMEMVIILYEKIIKIYENDKMIIIKLNDKERAYVFITKTGLNSELFAFLSERFSKCWKHVEKLEDFQL